MVKAWIVRGHLDRVRQELALADAAARKGGGQEQESRPERPHEEPAEDDGADDPAEDQRGVFVGVPVVDVHNGSPFCSCASGSAAVGASTVGAAASETPNTASYNATRTQAVKESKSS